MGTGRAVEQKREPVRCLPTLQTNHRPDRITLLGEPVERVCKPYRQPSGFR